ncbi:hypothetical protein ASF25_15855 [Methylobacterium sp. Leaf100]|nr:hypothetical protein ASF25_15855 [Methylobacterium sp. Leaf100]
MEVLSVKLYDSLDCLRLTGYCSGTWIVEVEQEIVHLRFDLISFEPWHKGSPVFCHLTSD